MASGNEDGLQKLDGETFDGCEDHVAVVFGSKSGRNKAITFCCRAALMYLSTIYCRCPEMERCFQHVYFSRGIARCCIGPTSQRPPHLPIEVCR